MQYGKFRGTSWYEHDTETSCAHITQQVSANICITLAHRYMVIKLHRAEAAVGVDCRAIALFLAAVNRSVFLPMSTSR
jgi:hypothetical protein